MKTFRCLYVCLCVTILSIGFSASALADTTYTNTNLTAAVNTTGNNITIDTNNGNYSASGYVISGTGSVTKQGGNTFTINSASTYSGATTISAGTLELSGSGVINTASVINIAENGTLKLASTTYSQNTPFANTITGAGTILQVASSAGMSSNISGFTGTFDIQKDIYFMNSINGSQSNWTVSGGATLKTLFGKTLQIKNITTDSGTYLARNWAAEGKDNATYKIGSGVISGTIGYTAGTNADQKRLMSMVALEKASDGTDSGGTLTLSGTNNYSGGTTITAGRIIATNVSVFGTGAVTNNAELEFNLATAGTYSKVLSGTGALYKTGAGTLTLSGANTYEGNTTISEGRIIATNLSAFGTGTVTNDSQLEFNLASNGTYSKVLSGTGALIKSGSGTLTLSGANTYEGGTTISGGKLAITNSEVLGSGAITLNGGTLSTSGTIVLDKNVTINANSTIETSNALSLSGNISGTAALTKTGTGTLTLSSANTHSGATTVSAGTMNLDIADAIATSNSVINNAAITATSAQTFKNLAGTVNTASINIGTNALTLNNTANSSYAGTITGAASITKSGTGTLTLSGANTYSGTTTISAGTLDLSGSGAMNAASVINIAENGTLKLVSTAYTQNTPFANTITGAGTILQVASSAGMSSDISGFTGTFKIQKDIYFTGNINGSKSDWTVSDGATLKNVAGKTLQIKNITTDSGTYLARNYAGATDPNAIYKIGSGTISGIIGYTAGTTDTQNQRMSGVALEKVSDGTDSGGTLTLSGTNNSYTGGTTITAGRIIATNTSVFGSGTVTNNAELEFNLTSNGTYGKVISGSGALIKSGTGTLTLSVANTYSGATTVSAGTLDLTNTSAAGTGAITLGDTNTVAQNVTLKLSATKIANNITVANAGTGTVTLYGNAQYSNSTGTITLNRDTYFEIPQNGTNDWWFQYTKAISGSGNIIVKGGAGTSYVSGLNRIWFSGDNSGLTGNFIVQSGAAQIGNLKAAGSGTIYIGNANSDTATVRLIFGVDATNKIVISADTPSTSMPVITSHNNLQTLTGDIAFNRSATLYCSTEQLNFQGVWSGTGDIIIDGSANSRVTHNTAANTWTGDMVIKSGATFQPGHAQTLSAANDIEVNGTLQLNGVNQTIGALSGAGTIKNEVGANTLTVDQATNSTFSGTLIDGSGVFTFIKDGAGTLTLSGTNTYTGATTISDGRIVATNTSVFGSGAVTNNSELEFNLASNGAYSKVLSGTGALIKSSDGTLTLSGANTYEGGTTISGGTLAISNSEALGTGEITLNGGTLSTTASETIVLDENVAINANSTIDTTNGLTLSGNISGTAALTKTGTGTLTLSSTNDFSGTTTISAGTLELDVADAIIKSTSVTNIAAITAASAQTFNNLAGKENTASITLTGGDLTLFNTDSTVSKYVGKIDVGAGKIKKTGPGTLLLLGVTENDIKASSFVVNSGRLDMKGYLTGSLEVETNGDFSPGNSVGSADVSGDFTLTGDLIMEVESATSFDTLTITGTTTYNEGSRIILNLYVPTGAETLELDMIKYTGTVTGTENWVLGANAYYWQDATFSNGKLNIKVNINAIPEPSTWALLILGALGMMYFRRKK